MERQAEVICSEVGGRGNKIFQYGETVFERNFPMGNFDKLIAGGFIKEKMIAMEASADAAPGPMLTEGDAPEGMTSEKINLEDTKGFDPNEEEPAEAGGKKKRKRK